jgi:hypothetical protein
MDKARTRLHCIGEKHQNQFENHHQEGRGKRSSLNALARLGSWVENAHSIASWSRSV